MTPRPPVPPGSRRAGFPAMLLDRANRPFTIAILLAGAALAVFLYLDGRPGGQTVDAITTTTPAEGLAGDTIGDAASSSPATDGPPGSSTTSPTTLPAPGTGGDLPDLAAREVASGFVFPVFAGSPPGDGRIFVAERAGVIRIVEPGGSVRSDAFLDISDRIDSASGVELGLLGVAFHPEYAANGRFFVHYTDLNADTIVAEYAVSSDPNLADPDSESVLLYVDQVGFRHRGGMLQFGPAGYLWIGLGDGTDMNVHPQNLDTLQGSILRIDVDGGDPYAIPADNPFADTEGRGEIWAYGLRNPWRFHVDGTGGRIYVGDVGEESWEEIDSVGLGNSGVNFGWPLMEGSTCFTDAECGSRTDLIRPVAEFSHEEDRCAVTGGYVYRGAAIPALTGHYFYADWCTGAIYSFLYDGENATRLRDWSEWMPDLGQVASFGLDGSGELLIVTSDAGALYRITPA